MITDTEYYAPMTIHFTREGKGPEIDDMIYIYHIENEKAVRVKYVDKESKKNYSFEDTWENVVDYLLQIFKILPLDEEPFEYIQFSFPAYPSVMVSVKDLDVDSDFMNSIFDMMDSVVKGWPVSTK